MVCVRSVLDTRASSPPLPGRSATLKTITSGGETGLVLIVFVAGEKPVKYTDPDGRNDEDVDKESKARDMLYQAVDFIKNNADTEVENMIAVSNKMFYPYSYVSYL
jgi:hypothetical protein